MLRPLCGQGRSPVQTALGRWVGRSGLDAVQHCSLPWSLSHLPVGVNGRGSSECPQPLAQRPRLQAGQQLQRSLWQGSGRRQRQERAGIPPVAAGQTKAGSCSACDLALCPSTAFGLQLCD